MTVSEILKTYDPFDYAILYHGFAAYMRDYVVLAEGMWGPEGAGQYNYTFTHCVVASCETRVSDDGWRESWGNEFIDYAAYRRSGEPSGFVWAASWSGAYPGLTHVVDSQTARAWSTRLGRDMHEIELETEAFRLQLVFHEVKVKKVSDKVDVINKVIIPL